MDVHLQGTAWFSPVYMLVITAILWLHLAIDADCYMLKGFNSAAFFPFIYFSILFKSK